MESEPSINRREEEREAEPTYDEEMKAWVIPGVDEKGRAFIKYYDEENQAWVTRYPYDEKAELAGRGFLVPKGNQEFTQRPDKFVGSVHSSDDGNYRAFDSNS